MLIMVTCRILLNLCNVGNAVVTQAMDLLLDARWESVFEALEMSPKTFAKFLHYFQAEESDKGDGEDDEVRHTHRT